MEKPNQPHNNNEEVNQQHPETSPMNDNNKHLQSHEKQNQPHNNKE